MTDDRSLHLRVIEALIFASNEPIEQSEIERRLPTGADAPSLLAELGALYVDRGVNLVRIGNGWVFRTAPDLAPYLQLERKQIRKLSRAALETLGIIAYSQPVTRAEIEEIRGVALSRGSLDVLLESGWIKPGRRRRTPGRPLTWVTTREFLDHFGLEKLEDLPGLDDLKASGLLESRPGVSAAAANEDERGSEEAEQEMDRELLSDTDPADTAASSSRR
jgi:segregation and condensation protein B